MASRKPLVIVDGQIQQLQSSDVLDASVSEVDVVAKQNDNLGSIVIGQPVYTKSNGNVDLAQADAGATVEVLGLVRDSSIAAAASGAIQTDGVLSATTGQWDTVTGETGGLTAGAVYYLDPSTPGTLTQTAPTTVGQFVVRVGRAISTTEMEISVSQPILL
jgi:hypothetical protein